MPAQPFAGVLVPVLTPFTPAGEPDAGRFVAFCRWLLDQGADGLAIFGTTSEANSMSAGERMALLDRLVASGIPPAKLMPGAGACSVTEAATLIRHAVGHGVGGVLMLPPFYYKGMDDDGLFAFFAGVIDRVASPALRKGAVGCITASGNVNVPGIRKVYENWKTPQADQLQAEITTARKTIQAYPMVPALKRIVAHFHNDPDWAAVRPPMVPLSEAQSKALLADLAKIGFTLGERRREAAE